MARRHYSLSWSWTGNSPTVSTLFGALFYGVPIWAAYQLLVSSVSLGMALLTSLVVSLMSRFKDSPFRETDGPVMSAASRIHTCAFIHAHDCSEDSVFRYKHQWSRNSALGWGIRPKRLLHLTVICSLHSHAFTLRVDCPLRLPLTRVSSSWISHFTLGLIINLFTFDNLTPPFVLFDRANERLRNIMFHSSWYLPW